MKRIRNKKLEREGIFQYLTQSIYDYQQNEIELRQTSVGFLVHMLGQYNLTIEEIDTGFVLEVGTQQGHLLIGQPQPAIRGFGFLSTNSLGDRLNLVVHPEMYSDTALLPIKMERKIRDPWIYKSVDEPEDKVLLVGLQYQPTSIELAIWENKKIEKEYWYNSSTIEEYYKKPRKINTNLTSLKVPNKL